MYTPAAVQPVPRVPGRRDCSLPANIDTLALRLHYKAMRPCFLVAHCVMERHSARCYQPCVEILVDVTATVG